MAPNIGEWLDALRSMGKKIEDKGKDQWMAQCPAHEDDTPSLSLWITDTGEVGHKCYAGCEWKEVKQAVGLWDEPKSKNGRKKAKGNPPEPSLLPRTGSGNSVWIYRNREENPCWP